MKHFKIFMLLKSTIKLLKLTRTKLLTQSNITLDEHSTKSPIRN